MGAILGAACDIVSKVIHRSTQVLGPTIQQIDPEPPAESWGSHASRCLGWFECLSAPVSPGLLLDSPPLGEAGLREYDGVPSVLLAVSLLFPLEQVE